MRILALDVGRRRTGLAYFDDATGIPLPLDTFRHSSTGALVAHVHSLAQERNVDRVVLGLPLLPSGDEGAQARYVREVASLLSAEGMTPELHDERYTTPRASGNDKHALAVAKEVDGDAAAACEILTSFLKC